MVRSGLLLGVSGPAAILTLLILPSVREGADRMTAPKAPAPAIESTAPLAAPGLGGGEPVSLRISPIRGQPLHLATMPRPESRQIPVNVGPSASEKEPLKPRRTTREGCEAPLSSLVGPEARRMLPGRCMT